MHKHEGNYLLMFLGIYGGEIKTMLCDNCLIEYEIFDGTFLKDGKFLCNHCISALPPLMQLKISDLKIEDYEKCVKYWKNRLHDGYLKFKPNFSEENVLEADDKNRLWRSPDRNNHVELFTYDEILDYELYEDSGSVQKNGIGRAVVGGFLAGSVGAIVGATTGKSERVINEMYITLALNNPWIKMLKIYLINGRTKTSSALYNEARKTAEKVIIQLKTMTTASEQQEHNNQTDSLSDQLFELKKVLDAGIITQEEFDLKKKQILGI